MQTQTLQDYRRQQAEQFFRRNYRQIRAEFWARKAEEEKTIRP